MRSAMSSASCAQVLKFAAATALVAPLVLAGPARAADATPSPCSDDAMIVFDASGSMAGNVSQGIATIKPRIDEARHRACHGPATRDTAWPRWSHHLWPWRLQPMQRPAQIRADAERRRTHHAGGWWLDACRAHASPLGRRGGGGRARLSQE